MPIIPSITGREFSKFVESPSRPGESAIEVVGSFGQAIGQFQIPINSKCYTYSTGTDGIYFTETYSFYESGTPSAPVNLLRSIALYYSDAAFENEVGGVST